MGGTDKSRTQPGFLPSFMIGGVAAGAAEVVCFPLDIAKTRMQIQGEMFSKGRKKSTFQTVRSITKKEGFFKLWRGLSPALARHLSYSGARLGIYGSIRDLVQRNSKDPSEFSAWKAALTGAAAGSFAQFLASPFDLIKILMQMDGIRELRGKRRRVRNLFHGIHKVYRKGGIRALWKGSFPNAQRGALVNMADIGTYDTVKRLLREKYHISNQFAVQCVGGFTAGFTASTLACPVDVIKARMMNQPIDDKGRGKYYTGTVDCILKTIRNEGPFALYKGFSPMWLRIGPFTMIFWNILELERNVLGYTQF